MYVKKNGSPWFWAIPHTPWVWCGGFDEKVKGSKSVKGRRMEVEVWENTGHCSIFWKNRSSIFIWPFLLKCSQRAMFSTLFALAHDHISSTACLYFHDFLMMSQKMGKILASPSQITLSVRVVPPKSIRCPEERASQKFTEIWHLKWWRFSESFTIWGLKFRWTIGDLCCRSKKASQLSRIRMAQLTSCFQSADSPWKFCMHFSGTYSNDLEVVEQQSCSQVLQCFMELKVRGAHQFDNCNEHLHGKHHSSGRENPNIVQTIPSPPKSNMAPSNVRLGKGNSPYLTSILGFQKLACKKCKKSSPASPQS